MVKRLSIGPTRYAMVIGMGGLVAIAAIAMNFAWRGITEPIAPLAGSGTTRSATAVSDPLFHPGEKAHFQPQNLIARPLFSPERRPPMPVVVKAPVIAPVASPVTDATPIYSVGGIVVSSRLSKALLWAQRREAGRWFALGETTDEGWTVTIIEPNQVTLARAERKMMLTLYARERPQPTAALRQ
jgi:hypothetical protein